VKGKAVIKAIHCNSKDGTFCELHDLDNISDLLVDEKNLLWLDLDNPTAEELAIIGEEFGFHPLAIEDVAHPHQRPKVEEYEHFFFVVFYATSIDIDNEELEISELKMFVGLNFLVTVHYEPIKEIAEAERRWQRNTNDLSKGIGAVLYSLLDSIVDNYFPVVDVLSEWADNLEDEIFKRTHLRNHNLTEKLLAVKKFFLLMRRITAPERDVLSLLTNRDNHIFNEHTLFYMRDVYDHLIRVNDTLDLYRDQISSIIDANLTVASNDLNKVMRTLTATSIILMSATLVAGIYGMNFENMPELKWGFGYFGALALMVGIMVGLYLYFKHLKWL
jgi:magnesium transporter